MVTKEIQQTKRDKFRFADHPWISLIVLNVIGIVAIILVIIAANAFGVPGNAPYRPLITPTLAHILVLFLIVPFVLQLPNGKTTFRRYLDDIRLTRVTPLVPLLLLGISTSLIMLLALSANSFFFRIAQGLPLSQSFLRNMIDLSRDLPPASLGYIVAFPAIFEEISFRGVLLVLFLRKYSAKQSILVTSLGFGLLHLINLIFSVDPSFVIRQVIMGSALGFFYGYMVLRVNSLLPAMLFHYLVNLFIGSFTHYFQRYGPDGTQILYLAINLTVTVPLLILWVKFFCGKWVSRPENLSLNRSVLGEGSG